MAARSSARLTAEAIGSLPAATTARDAQHYGWTGNGPGGDSCVFLG
jgi:hypothetical protein